MASVLASQLDALARQRQPALPAAIRKGKPSLLFDFQKAADVDLQTIYALACQGFEELKRLEPRFRPYRESLFSRASLDINPDMQTPDFLAKLSASIYGFCCLLSNHFLSPPAFKVLEYLIRRYKANERNVDALMTAALPYHSTNEFVRLVQTLALGAPGSLWGWLVKMQTSGAALPRDLLAQRCVNDRKLLLFICKAAGQLGGVASAAEKSGTSALRAQSRTFLSFYAVLLCEVLAVMKTVNEDVLAALLPHLLEGVGKGAAQDYRAATLMALAELFTRATLGRDFIKVTLNTMLKYTEPVPEHIRTVLLVMAHMAVTQRHIRSLSDKTLKYLTALPNVVTELAALAQRGSIRMCPLLVLITRSLSSLVAAGSSTGRRSEGDLLALAHAGALRGEPARILASALLEAGGADNATEAVRESCQRLLRVLDQRYPETTDAAVNVFLEPIRIQRQQSCNAKDSTTKGKRRKTDHNAAGKSVEQAHDDDDDCDVESADAAAAALSSSDRARFDFVRSTFVAGGYSTPCGGTMLTLAAALTAPQAAVRRMALQQLDADLTAAAAAAPADAETGGSVSDDATSEARAVLMAAALDRLRDDDLGVVVAALGLSTLKALPPAALLDALVPLSDRVGEYLYSTSKLPQLKAARKAARKLISLLRQVGSAPSSTDELKRSAALHLLSWMLPSPRDTRIAIEAARAAAKLDLSLFVELEDAVKKVEAESAEAGSQAGRENALKGKRKEQDSDAGATDIDKKAAQKASALSIARSLVAALAKALAADPAEGSSHVMRLVGASASAAAAGGDAAEAAARRAQHVLLLASFAASTAGASTHAQQLCRYVVDLAEVLLPYARYGGGGPDGGDFNWRSSFAEQVSDDDGLPTGAHGSAVFSNPIASHAALILGTLRASLARLPEASDPSAADAGAQASSAKRVLGLLASLDLSMTDLHDLPLLLVTRSVASSFRSAFLSDMYAAPAAAGPSTAQLQCLALYAQTQLATAESAAVWLVTLLPALSSPEAAVRSAACDCLVSVAALFAVARTTRAAASGAFAALSAASASQLCSVLLAHLTMLRRDPEAAAVLLQGALCPGAAAGEGSDAAAGKAAPVALPETVAAEVRFYMVSSLRGLSAEYAGVNTALVVLACLVDKATTASSRGVSAGLLSAGAAYAARLMARLRDAPASATALDAQVLELTVSLYTPASVAAVAASGDGEAALSRLAEAAELLSPPAGGVSAPLAASAVAALATVRRAAVRQVSRELFAALPTSGRTVRELFAVLLSRNEGDADEDVRAAARSALEAVPLTAELLLPLLVPPAASVTGPPPASLSPESGRAKKKSKKTGKPAADATVAVEQAATMAATPMDLAALRDAVAVLELLQWRTGIASPELLVTACQTLLGRLLPIIGSIVSVLAVEENDATDEDDAKASDTDSVNSSLAGYASTLALQALTVLAREIKVDVEQPIFDLELAVRTAREAPDAAVRNAALGLLAALATKMPSAALSHVLQVLALVNESAAVQDDEHSRAVGATALAAVVPAWVAAGQPPVALWKQVVSSLPSLPAHRRLDVLLALLRALPAVEEGLSDGLLVLLEDIANPKHQLAATAATPPTTGKTPRGKSKFAVQQPSSKPQSGVDAQRNTGDEFSPSSWLPKLASQLALQVELPMRLACFARVMELALSASGQNAHHALPRTTVVFVTAQLKLKVAGVAAAVSLRQPGTDPALDLGCRRLMEAALAQMQLLQPDTAAAKTTSAGCLTHLAVLAASRALYGLFGALQGIMAANSYLQSLLTLVEHPADKVKRRALKLFTDKVHGVRAEIEDHIELPQRVRKAKLREAGAAAARACAMLPPLLQSSSGASPLTRQLALLALSAIAAEFGAQQQASLLEGVPAVLSATKDPHASIRASALATVAAFVRALGPQLVPVLPSTVAAAVEAANAAWARLARSGGGDAVMEDAAAAAAKGVASDDDRSSDGDEHSESDREDGGVHRRRRGGGSDTDDAALELSSALACLNALVDAVGGFLSPHLPAILGILLNPRVLACTAVGCNKFADSIRGRLPTVIPPRLLLPALYGQLEPCLAAASDAAPDAAAGPAAPTVALLQMTAAAAAALEAKVAAQYCEPLSAFLLRALDVRQRRPPTLAAHGEPAIGAVEAATISAFVALVMKLSEARFKPLFLRLLEWASTVTVPETPGANGEPSYQGRMVALFGVVNALADRLRSVLVPYYRYLLDLCVQHLSGDEFSGRKVGRNKKKQRRGGEDAPVAAGEDGKVVADFQQQQLCLSWLLRLRIVRALHRCFLHDSVGFLDADRFAHLQGPLVSQLAAEPPELTVPYLLSPLHADSDLAAYVSLGASTQLYTAPEREESLGPLGAATVGCLLAMAVAANNDALWKPLNHATLMLTRSTSPRTRALALEVVAQLVDRLREEYLVLLPEALPFLSELLEDTDAAVAARVREVVAQLEEISGEKLDEYLKV